MLKLNLGFNNCNYTANDNHRNVTVIIFGSDEGNIITKIDLIYWR